MELLREDAGKTGLEDVGSRDAGAALAGAAVPRGSYVVGAVAGTDGQWSMLRVDSRTEGGKLFLRDFLERQTHIGFPPEPEAFAGAIRETLGMPASVNLGSGGEGGRGSRLA